MSRLDVDARVYADGDPAHELVCMWFAWCDNLANGTRRGPTGGGQFGDIPICQRCDDKVERLAHA